MAELNAMRLSVKNKRPGGIYRSECGAFFCQNRKSWQYLPIRTRGVFQSEPEFLAVFPSLNARRFSIKTNLNARRVSVRNKKPGGISQCECEAFFGQNQNSWRYFPVCMRGVFRPEPKFLAAFTSLNARCLSVRTIFPSLNARCLSVRTKIPGGVF